MSRRWVPGKIRWTQTVIALAAVCGALLATTTEVSAAPGAGAFSAQARRAGLTGAQAGELQSAVNAELARAGGTQVAANKIERPGATVLLPLPGEKYARDLTSPAYTPGAGKIMAESCPKFNFCQYSNVYFTGMVEQRYYCTEYKNYLVYDGSWINNQSAGTTVKMKDKGGVVRYTSPVPYSSDDVAPWNWVGWIVPCGPA